MISENPKDSMIPCTRCTHNHVCRREGGNENPPCTNHVPVLGIGQSVFKYNIMLISPEVLEKHIEVNIFVLK